MWIKCFFFCLILNQVFGLDNHLIVQDSTSNQKFKSEFKSIQLIKNEESKGLIYSRNRLLNLTKVNYAISLDDDAHFITENVLELIETYFTKNSNCGLIAFRIFWGVELPENTATLEKASLKSFLDKVIFKGETNTCSILS